MGIEQTIQIVEIDIDQCTRTWGNYPCLAAFNLDVTRKCYNSWNTCAYKQAFNKGVNTLRFCESTYGIKGGNYYPVLKSVSGRNQEVNIAGFSDKIGGLGVRASVQITLEDFPDRDTLTDKYWQERISGAAQTTGAYDPYNRGSFWIKFKQRNPNYAGRPIRVIEAYFNDAGALVTKAVRRYVMDTISNPSGGTVTITAKDVLSLADDKKALVPKPSRGVLLNDITDAQTTAVLSPAGIGAEYPASGYICVGSEVMRFTRSGLNLTLTRGQRGTQRSTHDASDSVQLCYDVQRQRGDAVIAGLLTGYGNLPASAVPTAEYAAEFGRWGNQFILSTTITKPMEVTKALAEICRLGVAIWSDEVSGQVKVRINRPEQGVVKDLSDTLNIISISSEDNDDQRATQIFLKTVQIDPTKDLAEDNFLRNYLTIDLDAENTNNYGLPRTETIPTRWLNHGAGSFVNILSGRLLNRYSRAPITWSLKVDANEGIGLTDVVGLETFTGVDDTGLSTRKLTQVYFISNSNTRGEVELKLQGFQFDQRYGNITENSRPRYNASTEAQKARGVYFVGPSGVFSDGRRAYQFI